MSNTVTLDDPATQELKARWESRANTGIRSKLEFEEWFSLFLPDGPCFTDIGAKLGVSGERIRQIYVEDFEKVIGVAGGKCRRREKTEARQMDRLRELEQKFTSDPVVISIRSLVPEGFRVEPEQRVGKDYFNILSTRIRINGHVCSLRRVHQVHFSPLGHRPYWRAQVSLVALKVIEAEVIYAARKGYRTRVFVIPSSVLLKEMYAGDCQRDVKHLYLPTARAELYRGIKPKIDWWQYENAFHLLRAHEPAL